MTNLLKIPLERIYEMKTVTYNNTTITNRLQTNDGEVYIGSFNGIEEGNLILGQDEQSLIYQQYEQNNLNNFINNL